MSPFVTIVLLAMLNAVSYAKPVETTEVMTKNSTTQSYYPADMLNLVTLGMFGNAKKYLFADQRATWMEASYFCNAHDMDLVTIETKEENDAIMEHIASLGTTYTRVYWTSGHKIGRSTWLWINGDFMIFSDWDVDHPFDPAVRHCMMLYYGHWRSFYCHNIDNGSTSTAYICEERKV